MLPDDDIEKIAEAVVAKLPPVHCVFSEKQKGVLKVTANTLRFGAYAFLTGVGASGAGMLLLKLFGS